MSPRGGAEAAGLYGKGVLLLTGHARMSDGAAVIGVQAGCEWGLILDVQQADSARQAGLRCPRLGWKGGR